MRCAEWESVGRRREAEYSYARRGTRLTLYEVALWELEPHRFRATDGREGQGNVFYRNSLLVTRGRGFYNPINTTIGHRGNVHPSPGAQLPNRTDVYSASECLSIDSHFRISQEH